MTGPGSASPPSELGPENRWLVLTVLSAAVLILVIDFSVLYIVAPSIAADLDPSATSLLWIIDIYALVSAPLLVLAGTLGDRFGRKRLLLIGLVIFTVASAFAAFAWSPGTLILARAIQGVGGALIMPNTMSMIRAVFPDRGERVKAVGIWSAVFAGGAAAGPLLGGLLVEHFWWGSVFLINVPILLIVLPFAIRILPESRSSDPPPRDILSVFAVAGGVLTLAYGIKHGVHDGLVDPLALGPLVISALLLTIFTRRQLASSHPMLDMRLLARTGFAVAVVTVFLVMLALLGLELFFAQYLQIVLELSPLQASMRLLPLVLATVVGSLLAARLIRRWGARPVMAGGLGVAALGVLPLLALGGTDDFLLLSVPFVVLGFFLQAALVAANDTILSTVSADDAGQAASIEATAYDLGGGIGIAVLGSIGAAVYTKQFPDTAGREGDPANSVSQGLAVAKELPGALGERLLVIVQDTFLTSFHVVIAVAFLLLAVGAIIAALGLPRRGAKSSALPGG